MRPVLIVPGIGNSGPDHWQTRWERQHEGLIRIAQQEWDQPVASDWLHNIDAAVAASAEPPLIVAHSLGCLAVALWAEATPAARRRTAALVLVAVPDPSGPVFPRAEARGFERLAGGLGRREGLVVSSRNDPYAPDGFGLRCAQRWGVQHLDAGAGGHLNAASGLGDWPSLWQHVQDWRTRQS